MSVEKEVVRITPIIVEESSSLPHKRGWFSSRIRNQNKPESKKAVSKGCHNCSNHLTRFYYWKQSPCDACLRSPAHYYYLPQMNLIDNWQESPENWSSLRNLIY